MKKLVSLLSVVAVCSIVAYAAVCSIKPTFLVQTSPSGMAEPGDTITLRVDLNQAASGPQSVSVSADDYSQFSSLPTSVTVPNGQASAYFQATLAEDAEGEVTVQVACNGQSAHCGVEIANVPDFP